MHIVMSFGLVFRSHLNLNGISCCYREEKDLTHFEESFERVLDNAIRVDDKTMCHLAEAMGGQSASERLDVGIEALVMKWKLAPHQRITGCLFTTDLKVVNRIREKMASLTVADFGTWSTAWTDDTFFGICVSRDFNSTIRTMKDLTLMNTFVYVRMVFESKRCRATVAKDFVSVLTLIGCNSRLRNERSGYLLTLFFISCTLPNSGIFLGWTTLDDQVQNFLILRSQDVGGWIMIYRCLLWLWRNWRITGRCWQIVRASHVEALTGEGAVLTAAYIRQRKMS
jgi:hypothetical protein